MSNTIRLTGMASGLDTDSLVKQMMKPYIMKVDKVKADNQILQWKQDLYRDVLGDMNTFKSTYFDVLKSDTYMLSTNNYSGFDITTTPPVASSANVAAYAGAVAGNYEVNVTQLATAAVKTGNTINGTGSVTASTKLTDLLPPADSAVLNLDLKYNGGGIVSVQIDNSSGTKTIGDVINAVNSATSGNVVAKYSELTKTFSLQTSATGSDKSLSIEGGSASLLSALGQSVGAGNAGTDASLTIQPPGGVATAVTKSSNVFTIDNVKYTLNSTGVTDINITSNSQKTFDKIKGLIDKYNDLIGKINTKLEEKNQRSYQPLTDEQKQSMTADQIKSWESKAQEGLLRNDGPLRNMVDSMRRAFYDAVQGAGVNLNDIGLSTSSDISQRGKIIIDETKLKSAIENNGSNVANIFMKISSTSYNPDGNNSTRYNEEGIFQRINDIFSDYSRSTRNSQGKKGILVEKAGLKGDISELTNMLTQQMEEKNKMITEMTNQLNDKENSFYAQFSKLETAMQQANSQSSWISKQFGG